MNPATSTNQLQTAGTADDLAGAGLSRRHANHSSSELCEGAQPSPTNPLAHQAARPDSIYGFLPFAAESHIHVG